MSTATHPTLMKRIAMVSILFAVSGLLGRATAAEDRLPARIDANAAPSSGQERRGWTIKDSLEISRIESTAVSENGGIIAFLIKHSSIGTGDIRYGLYLYNRTGPEVARKLIEAEFLGELSRHPGTPRWTVLGNLGSGVQLYDIDDQGGVHGIVLNNETVRLGGRDSAEGASAEPSRPVGVMGYEWAPDGSALWYLRPRARPPADQAELNDRGIVFDPRSMASPDFFYDKSTLLGTELRLFVPAAGTDRLLSFVPRENRNRLRRDSVSWSRDSRSIQYLFDTTDEKGERKITRWTAEVETGKSRPMAGDVPNTAELFYAAPRVDGNGYLVVRAQNDERHLVEVGPDGKVAVDHGPVDFVRLDSSSPAWWDRRGQQAILSAVYRDRNGLVAWPSSQGSTALASEAAHLSNCSFTPDLSFGTGVRESLTTAPELVAIFPREGRIESLVRPNARYDQIAPLRSEYREWTNRYGGISDGYVTYPRNFVPGRKYPTILVTHAQDAKNRFLYNGFQWDHPIQVLAESGYVIISLNDPRLTADTSAAANAFLRTAAEVPVAKMQFHKNINPLASAEAALQSLVDAGIADPERTGIAGYSRGCEVVEFVMTQSKRFKVAVNGDAGGWNPALYWSGGIAGQAIYRTLYGGSVYEPANLENYRKYSTVFRAREFAGPLLQQFAASSGVKGLELDVALRDAGVPTELVFYRDETHLFWHPRHRAAAMERTIDWFNFWLLGKRDTAPEKQEAYNRRDRMAALWKQSEKK